MRRSCAWSALVLLLVPAVSWALPDLVPELYGLRIEQGAKPEPGDVAEGCAGASDGLTLFHFGVRFHNIGPDPLVIGDPGCPICADNPGAVCTDPRFICSPAAGHNHPHFLDFARYELLDFRGNLVKAGGKKSFCVRDNRCDSGTPQTTCLNQGLSPGCVDDYDPTLGCQYIDVTNVPNVLTRAFRLRVTLDPDQQLPDANRSNNATELDIPGCGDGIVQPPEECDPGATPRDPCCGDDCHLARPGSPCEVPPGPCGRPEAPLPDGTMCGTGDPPCMTLACHAGVCEEQAGSGGCLIGATCFAPGRVDPVNACQRCDPTRQTSTWSLNLDPDPAGLRCQVDRVAATLVGAVCAPRPTHVLDVGLAKMGTLLDQLEQATVVQSGRLDRRLVRQMARVKRGRRLALRAACQVDRTLAELDRLDQQFAAFKQVARKR